MKKITPRWLVFVISFVVTVLSTSIDPQTGFGNWQKLLLELLGLMSVCVLFYTYLGPYTVDKIFAALKKKIDIKLGKDEVTP